VAGRKKLSKDLEHVTKAVGGGLPPVFAGPPSWAPVGYVCTPADVVELLVPGHRRASTKERAEWAAAWNKARAEQPPPPRPAPRPAEPRSQQQPPSPHEPIPLPPIDHMEQEWREQQAKLAAAWQRDTRPDDPGAETRRQIVARG
jgi:hypothetical protein